MPGSRTLGLLAGVALALPVPATGAEAAGPVFVDPQERAAPPTLPAEFGFDFVVATDFPPFSRIDASGVVSGFNVDLAREICRALSLLDRCRIAAVPFAEVEAELDSGRANAALAGIAMSAENRERLAFSRTYFQFPARLIGRKGDDRLPDPGGKRVGVVGGGALERMLRDYFPEARVVTYSRPDWMFDDLGKGSTDLVFGDGLSLSFFLASPAGAECCAFAGGAYLAPEYLGAGLAVAAPIDQPAIPAALDNALIELSRNGTLESLYLRYFPVGLF